MGPPGHLRAARHDDGRCGPGAREVKVLVTGADGFVGRWLIRRLLDDGREVFGAVRPAVPRRDDGLTPAERDAVRWLPLEITDDASVRQCVDLPYDAVVHLAAVASGADALRDPGTAWTVNAAGTARLAHVLAEARRTERADPVVLVVSTGEVYGRGEGHAPRRETDPPAPCSPYAASKLGGEEAALEAWRRAGASRNASALRSSRWATSSRCVTCCTCRTSSTPTCGSYQKEKRARPTMWRRGRG